MHLPTPRPGLRFNAFMATVELHIQNGDAKKTVTVDKGTRLSNAIEAAGIDILHRCGGNARCTTCQVGFHAGEPRSITEAERDKLAEKELSGVRLSCQVQCNQDMAVAVKMTVTSSGLSDAGGPPEAHITPVPVWI
jgi:ferredoxin